LASKRQQIKSSFYIHKHLGTKKALERAIEDLYPDSQIQEWYEYGGAPYHFKIVVNVAEQRADIPHSEVISMVDKFQNKRSILEAIDFVDSGGTTTTYAMGAVIGICIEMAATAVNY
jgi:P2-related tail formation protein